MAEMTILDVLADVEPCDFPIEADWEDDHWAIVRCGKPAVDDEDVPSCAEHLGAVWP